MCTVLSFSFFLSLQCRLLGILLCPLFSYGAKHSVASQESRNSDHTKVFQCAEHVQITPVGVVQQKYCSKSKMKSNCTKGKAEVVHIGSNFYPQNNQDKEW